MLEGLFDRFLVYTHNEEARGEGTSAQGAVSIPGTWTCVHNAKAKGKEPESLLNVIISEDEFELVGYI
jgi:enhancer of polycomb-like protein